MKTQFFLNFSVRFFCTLFSIVEIAKTARKHIFLNCKTARKHNFFFEFFCEIFGYIISKLGKLQKQLESKIFFGFFCEIFGCFTKNAKKMPLDRELCQQLRCH